MPSLIQQKFFLLQEKAAAGSTIIAGPFYDVGSAELACQGVAGKPENVGISFVVVKTTAGFATDSPQVVALDFFQPAPGQPPLDL